MLPYLRTASDAEARQFVWQKRSFPPSSARDLTKSDRRQGPADISERLGDTWKRRGFVGFVLQRQMILVFDADQLLKNTDDVDDATTNFDGLRIGLRF